ncbi:MAG: TolB family protein, partial [Actinomycetota bacterium]
CGMPDLREVFQMSTQKVRPDRGFTERQDFRQRRRMRNRKVGAYAVVAAIAVVAVVAIAAVRTGPGDTAVPVSSPPPSGPTVVSHSYFDIATGERTPVAADLSGAQVPEVSPNLRNIAYGFDVITVAALDGSERTTITPEDLDGYAPTWIDDETILFQGRTAGTGQIGDLYVADIASGEQTMVVDLPDLRPLPWFVRSDLSPDGTTVLFHLPRALDRVRGDGVAWDLWTAPLAGGEATLLQEDAGMAAYTPDGSIVFLDHMEDFASGRISIMAGDGSNERLLVKVPNGTGWPHVSPDGTMVAFGEFGTDVVQIADIATGENLGEIGDDQETESAWYGNDTLIVD